MQSLVSYPDVRRFLLPPGKCVNEINEPVVLGHLHHFQAGSDDAVQTLYKMAYDDLVCEQFLQMFLYIDKS